jgi:hypothetical protein
MATPTGGPPPSNGRGAWDRPALLASLAMGGLFVIVLAVSLLIGRQNARPDPPDLATAVAGDEGMGNGVAGDEVAGSMTAQAAGAATAAVGGDSAAGTLPGGAESAETAGAPADGSDSSPGLPGSAAPTATAAAGRPLVPPAGTTVRLETYRDPQGEFQLMIDRSWQAAETDGEGAPPAAERDLTFVQPASGARLAVSIWDAAAGIALDRLATDLAPGLVPVDGRWPSNAMVAGERAIVLWAPESPAVPAVYAVFFEHEGRVYRVAYAANDGGAALLDFLRLLVTLEWIAPDGSVGDTIDTIPPLAQPPSRYFPSAALLESDG